MNVWKSLRSPPWRTIVPAGGLLFLVWAAYLLWRPGLDVRDGRHDRGSNGIWLAHGWLGGDEWFLRNGKTNEFARFRDPARIHELAERLRRNHTTDVFPHLCPAEPNGDLPPVHDEQVERFLDALSGFRVMPWVGGPNGVSVQLNNPRWRSAFVANIRDLLAAHPRLAGVQINIEPLASGNNNFLQLLEELRASLPNGKIISIAAYPPPTRWHPYEDLHWDAAYYREVARRSDQLAVMMYDAGQRVPKTYQRLMADWTDEVLAWSGETPVLLGIPAYDDAGTGYHHPDVENITNALLGIHRGLSRKPLPENYHGVAVYSEWETSEAEWRYFKGHFLNANGPNR